MHRALKKLWPEKPPRAAEASYIALLEAARNPFFFGSLGVPDTLDGRFEVIVLHLFLVQQRLCGERGAEDFARGLSEVFFDDMHRAIRELGVLDPGKRVKRMGKAYHGRLQAYTAASDREALKAALARNLYGTVKEGDVVLLERMARYAEHLRDELATTSSAVITGSAYRWPDPAGIVASSEKY